MTEEQTENATNDTPTIAGAAVWVSFLVGGIIALLQGFSFPRLGARYPIPVATIVPAWVAEAVWRAISKRKLEPTELPGG